jgi:hypothetical protein
MSQPFLFSSVLIALFTFTICTRTLGGCSALVFPWLISPFSAGIVDMLLKYYSTGAILYVC